MDLVTGPFRPALEDAFLDAFARLRSHDVLGPLAVVAPSQRLADHLKLLALRAAPRGFAAVRFHNLFSFAREIAGIGSDAVLADDLVAERLVRALLRRHFSDAPYLSRASLAPRALLGALRSLQAGGVEPGPAFEALKDGFLSETPEEAIKLGEILNLYGRYTEELRRRKILERADVVRLAVERADRSPVLARLKHVVYYGFVELDQNQAWLLEKVRRAVPTTVFFPYEPSPGYAFAKEFLETVLAPLASSTRVAPGRPRNPSVRQVSVSGVHDEVWAAAKEILRLSDEGVPFDRIGLVARTLKPYLDPVEAVFRDHRIPWVSSARRPLGRDGRVKAARLLFTIDDFDRADVLDLLRSPYFHAKAGDKELWDAASRRMGIGHGSAEWRRRLGGAAGKDWTHTAGARAGAKPFMLPKAEVGLFWDAVRGLLDAPPPPETSWKAWSTWALDRMKAFLDPDPRLEAAVARLDRLEGFALDEPREALLDALAELSEPAGTPGVAGVRVYDAMAARGCTFDALVVVGMNERVFPRFILEDPFLSDAVRSRFEFRLGCRMPRKLKGIEEERLLFTMLEAAAPRLTCVYQRSDDAGRLQIESSFMPMPESETKPLPRRPSLRLEETDFQLLTPREAALRTGQGEELGRALGRSVEGLVVAKAFVREIETRGKLTSYDGRVDTSAYWPQLAGFGISPTALEKLAECPFQYFAMKMLDLEELEEPEGESAITPLETGDLYHEVLEAYHRGGGTDLDRRIAEGVARFEASRSIRYPVLWEVERDRIAKVLRAFVDADDCTVFKPRDFEVKLQGELPVAAGGRASVVFRGYADRLDVADSGAFRVVDYKRSGKKYRDAMETGVFKKGRFLQPPLYFLLAQKMLNAPGPESRFVYYFLEEALDGEKWEKALLGDGWERKPEFEAHLNRYLDRIARGEFILRDGKHCQFCDVRAMCRRTHWPTRVRCEEADDPAPDGEPAT